MNITRRTLLAGSTALGLAACATTTATQMTPGQIVADITGIVNGLKSAVSGIVIASPTLIPPATLATIQSYVAQAEALLGSVTTAVEATASASVLNQIVSAVTAALTSLGGLALIPPPYGQILAAIGVVLPIIQVFVAQYIPTAPVPPAAAAPAAVAKARATLGIAVVP